VRQFPESIGVLDVDETASDEASEAVARGGRALEQTPVVEVKPQPVQEEQTYGEDEQTDLDQHDDVEQVLAYHV
jgi:hypothetical protein